MPPEPARASDEGVPVEAVLLDVDDTLVAYRRSVPELLAVAFDRVGVDPFFGAQDYYDRYDRFVDVADGTADLRERCFASLARERGRDPAVGRAVARAYAAERDHANVRPLPGAREAVAALSERHRLGVVTNGAPDAQGRKLAAVGFADAFDVVVHAGYDAPAKPAPAPFDRALGALGVAPARAVHAGDSLRSDVAGARAAGLRTVLVAGDDPPPDPDPEPDHVVRDPRGLCEPPWPTEE